MAENCFQQVSALDLAPKGSWPGFGLKRPSWSWSGRKYRGMLTTSNRLYFEILQRRDKKNHEHCFGGWLSSPPFSGIYIYIYKWIIPICRAPISFPAAWLGQVSKKRIRLGNVWNVWPNIWCILVHHSNVYKAWGSCQSVTWYTMIYPTKLSLKSP